MTAAIFISDNHVSVLNISLNLYLYLQVDLSKSLQDTQSCGRGSPQGVETDNCCSFSSPQTQIGNGYISVGLASVWEPQVILSKLIFAFLFEVQSHRNMFNVLLELLNFRWLDRNTFACKFSDWIISFEHSVALGHHSFQVVNCDASV